MTTRAPGKVGGESSLTKRFALGLWIGCAILGILIRVALAQTPSTPVPPPSAPAKRSAAELEKMAMPIALHPDPLVSIILPAAVYPLEIIMAARFVKDTNNMSKLDAQPWDENVKAVARFPELIAKMDEDLTWTISLGQAFLEQRKELMDTIQALRLKAQTAGTLKTTPQQIVTVTNAIIEKVVEQQTVVVTNTIVQIVPSNPEVIYVPSYPATVYYPPPPYAYGHPYYYGYGYYPYAPLLTFSAGFFWGAAISHWNHCDWHGGDVNIDIDRNTNIDRGDRTNIRGGDRVNALSGDRAGNRGQQRWQPDQGRLQRSGAATPKTREARGWNNPSGGGGLGASQRPSFSGGARPSQQPSFGVGGARPSQQPIGGVVNRAQTQPARSPSVSQRPSAAQRPATSSFDRAGTQRSSAFGGISSGGGGTRSYSNRGTYSRGGGGFGGGGGRGGGGRR